MQLQETVWTPGTVPRLDSATQVLQPDGPYAHKPGQMWAVYIPGKTPRIVMSARFTERDESFPALRDYLQRLAPSSFMDYLFAVDTYRACRILGGALPEVKKLTFTADPIVDEVLARSHGILLWQDQLEQLAQLFLDTQAEATELRRHVNQKRPSVFAALNKMALPSGQTLANVVKERLLYEGVVPGQWKAARLLFEQRGR